MSRLGDCQLTILRRAREKGFVTAYDIIEIYGYTQSQTSYTRAVGRAEVLVTRGYLKKRLRGGWMPTTKALDIAP